MNTKHHCSQFQNALAEKDLPLARQLLTPLLSALPNDPNVSYLNCLLLRLEGKYGEAKRALLTLTDEVKDLSRAFQELATVNLSLNEPRRHGTRHEQGVALGSEPHSMLQYLALFVRSFSQHLSKPQETNVIFWPNYSRASNRHRLPVIEPAE